MIISRRYLFTIFLVCLSLNIKGQIRDPSFYANAHAQNVDYHSFASMLVLKHDIGSFHKLPKNPVLTPSRGGWDRKDVSDPHVLVTADSIYLFYDGSSGGRYSIGYAVQDPEGWSWIKRRRVLETSNSDWDAYHQIDPNIIRVGEQWRLYYSGNSSDSEFGYQIGAAAKNEQGKWDYPQQTPVMVIDSTDWDFAGNIYASVHYFPEMGLFKMWYTGFQGPFSAIGLAESEDGYNWRKIGDSPIFTVFPGVIAPAVIYDGEKYVMYFAQLTLDSGFQTKICRAESMDGIDWQNIEDVLIPTEKWEGSKLMRPDLSFFDQRVHLFYCAQKGGNWRIGEAVANATFEGSGIWRSKAITKKANQIQIKFEQPKGTSIKASIIELKTGKRFAFPLMDNASQIRRGVYSVTLTDLQAEGDWQIELELDTTLENRSPVVYEIILN